MRIQKFLALGAVSVLTLSLLSIPAFAHGGHHGYSAHQNSACSVCHAENHSEACWVNPVSRRRIPAICTKTTEDFIQVDFNHPFAGKTLEYEIELLSITDE